MIADEWPMRCEDVKYDGEHILSRVRVRVGEGEGEEEGESECAYIYISIYREMIMILLYYRAQSCTNTCLR